MEWVELHAHSYFSFLDGASSPEELVEHAGRLEIGTLALTDHGGLYGAVRFARACSAVGVRPVFGAELGVRVDDGVAHLLLLVRDRRGWGNLCRLLSIAGRTRTLDDAALAEAALAASARARGKRKVRADAVEAPAKGRGAVEWADLEGRTEGLVALSGCAHGWIAERLAGGDRDGALARARALEGAFGRDNVRLEVWRHLDRREQALVPQLLEMADRLGWKAVATNVSHYATAADRRLADVLTCIRAHRTLDGAGTLLKPSDRWALPARREMEELFADRPDALRNAGELAAEIAFDLRQLSFGLPACPLPGGETPYSYLFALVQQGAADRYRPMTPQAARQIAHELDVIQRLDLAGYFLLVWDIVRFCNENRIRVQGRGSAANSAVCYCLGITAVDPVRLSLLFERFLSAERGQPPDIDLDIAHQDRERVIQYIYQRYGRQHAGMVAEVICYRARLAAREAGKVVGLSVSQVDRIASLLGSHAPSGEVRGALAEAGFDPDEPRMRALIEICEKLDGVPRHLGIHVGGMIITAEPLCELVPVEDASMPGRTVIQWDKDDVSDLGMAKIDLLGLGMLTAIGGAIDLVGERGIDIDPARLSYDEPEVFDMLCDADTVGVFQVESRAQMVTLPRLKPRTFYDLVIEVALIRPGPIQGDMVHPYLRRRAGQEPVTFPHPSLEPVLGRTLGIPLFQEQGMRVAVIAAGFSAGEADELRRAMGQKRSERKMRALSQRLRDGMLRRGLCADSADTIIHQLTAFANYGFPESHAASFALLVYVSAHIKRWFPAEYVCALLNAQPMGFYAPATLVADARRHGVEVRPIDLARSDWDCTIERGGPAPDAPAGLRLGLRMVQGLGPAAQERLQRARSEGPFTSVEDVVARAGLPSTILEKLAAIGCLASFDLERREAIWQVQAAVLRRDAEPLVERAHWAPLAADPVPLPPMGALETMAADYRAMGLSTGVHPMQLVRAKLRERGVLEAAQVVALGRKLGAGNGNMEVRKGPRVRVAGVAISRQGPPTAKGFIFITLEDETGFANVIVRPDVVEKYRAVVVREAILYVEGGMSVEGGTVNILARHLEPLALDDPRVRFRSRDFR